MTERRRVKGWHFALLMLGALLVIALTFWIWIQSVADRRWAEMRERVEELHDEALARTGERPVLRGTAVPGRAFDDYDLAIAEANRIPDMIPLGEFVSRTVASDQAKVEAIHSAHSILLDHLARGAKRAIGVWQVDWENATNSVPGLLDAQIVSNFVASRARLLAAEGKTGEAVDVLLDGFQFGRDHGDNSILIGRMISVAISRVCLDELKTLLEGKALEKEVLRRLKRGLQILDDHYPGFGEVVVSEALYTGFAVQNEEDAMGADLGSWRFGFSRRLMLADAVLQQMGFADRIAAVEGAPWGDVRRVLDEIQDEAQSRRNPLLEGVMNLTLVIQSIRIHRTRIRLIRAGVDFRLEGRVPTLPDPFGKDLLHARGGGILKIWSVNRDGVDDGGRGSWDRLQDPDCVLELKE